MPVPAQEKTVPEDGPTLPSENFHFSGITLRTPYDHVAFMPISARPASRAGGWRAIPDPDGRYSTGIADFDRLLGGGIPRGTMMIFSMDDTVGLEDLDLILFPTVLNMLYQSRGMIAVLPSRDSPHDFRARMTRYVTRRRFDSRVRVIDYVGEDVGPPYVVNLNPRGELPDHTAKNPRARKEAIAKMVEAEKVVQGGRKRTFIELVAFEVFETLMGVDKALQMFFYGIKRTRSVGNLGIGLLGPGLGVSAGVRRLCDSEFSLHRDEVGLIVRGVRPAFSSCVVTTDLAAGPPHVAFVPRPS